jgi:electron transfer flavoprotein-quinone oxidoreductase
MMHAANYDVIVIGAGSAGLTAALGLARAGFAVAVLEAGAYPGAENWSGCVYFCENLADPEILGPEGVEALAWERRLVERGLFATDGHGLLGMTYRDAGSFRHCYTVLRPIYDHHLAQVARRLGVTLLCRTTALNLIREGGRVIGVSTSRGPLYADLVFLAEGDASQLVTREGYERSTDRRRAPKFLQGIKLIVELPPGAIEERFGLGAEEGAAYEMLLRNGTLHGKPVHLNMGGFLYTNRQSLSLGLVLPADNLREHFEGDPNLLIEWFASLPALQPWLQGGKRGTFGAKLIRGGGAKDIPTLVDEGLAVGGAASSIGIDFPYPNFTGPATAMGLFLARAARRIRDEGGDFSRAALERHYLTPLRQTHYWRDVEFLRNWPGYVKKTRTFFDHNLDLALGSAYVWTRSNRWLLKRWASWLRLVTQIAGPTHWPQMQTDAGHLSRALHFRSVLPRPTLGQLLLDGSLNAFRDLLGHPRANLPAAGQVRLHYRVAGGAEPSGLPPATLRRWFGRFAPVLASAARLIYQNDETPLADKLPRAVHLLIKQVNFFDLLTGVFLAAAASVSGTVLSGWDRLRRRLGWRKGQAEDNGEPKGLYADYARSAGRAADLTPALQPAAQVWDARLARLQYDSVKASHIHVLWPKAIQDKNKVVHAGLWHICPAHVYEARQGPGGQVQVVINFENCIKCETCWRVSDLVDWGRDGEQRFAYAVPSPAVARLLTDMESAGTARPTPPRVADWWAARLAALKDRLSASREPLTPWQVEKGAKLHWLLDALDRKLDEFDAALAEEPRTVDRGRAEFLEALARYALQLAIRLVEVLRESEQDADGPAEQEVFREMLTLATAAAAKAEERARHTWDQRYSWASGDGRQLRQHHLAGLRRYLELLASGAPGSLGEPGALAPGVKITPVANAPGSPNIETWKQRLDAVFPPSLWRDLEQGMPLTAAQDRVLLDLLSQVPAEDLHSPLRKGLLAELGRRDPSLAYLAASHLWARDLALLAPADSDVGQAAQRWAAGQEWGCLAPLDEAGKALFVPLAPAKCSLLLFTGDSLRYLPSDKAGEAGVEVGPLAALGLRGTKPGYVSAGGTVSQEKAIAVDPDRARRLWTILSAADLISIAYGMSDLLCRRAIEHATSRVQFPGLFHDEEARDTIGKFGAVKKMIAEMAARRYLLETLDYDLSPADDSAESARRAALLKALAAEVLGTAPSSVSYNAGQVFGGTGYSEDDLLSKYYRDAAAWRFLGPDNPQAFLRQGTALLGDWDGEGHHLSGLPDEAQLFDQLAQRKALQAELDEVRVHRSRIRGLVGQWRNTSPADEADTAELAEALGRQDAFLLASKALLLRTHARLEAGVPSETELALVRVWLDAAAAALGEFEGTVRRQLDRAGRHEDRPVVDPAAGPPLTTYADFLTVPCPYDSGDFLLRPTDVAAPRYVPEMVETDPALAARNREIRDLLNEQFAGLRDGLCYERWIEKHHRPSDADLDFLRQCGYFRMLIPREQGGEGRSKADYYLLTTNAHRLADVAVSLTIQVNSSLGTTPILLARDKDLPKAQKDLAPLVGEASLQEEVRECLRKVQGGFLAGFNHHPTKRRQQQEMVEVMQRLQETVSAQPALRTLSRPVLDAWHKAAPVLEQGGKPAAAALAEVLAGWEAVCSTAAELSEELGRRRQACDLYLRWIAAGQISAFALTEPSAGSDTARVATRAKLQSVPVEVEPDGVLRFVPAGGKGPRYLLDAQRLEFRTGLVHGRAELRAFYRWSNRAEPALIHFDEYDYETDDPRRLRYYDHGGRRIHFTDIAQLRKRDGKLWYDYWELNGAKMWITNGRVCGVLCLYAKTETGVTGFLVDRHAEGLTVGKDEDKMGQCGSPTNELSLQAVRVPRENVLGLEGRGQVNALETLNVGRAGLAMSAMCQMKPIIESCRSEIQQSEIRNPKSEIRNPKSEMPAWVAWRIKRMEEERFIAEALAYEVIGRFEHKGTKSVRLESAVAKMLASELLHSLIETAEEIHGLEGQTERHLIEKRKRDARVLTIYEGTNEIQRFFILKDVVSEVAPRWGKPAEPATPAYISREAVELDALKGAVWQRVQAALEVFGQQLWQNPNLQANCFLLSEAVAWVQAAESSLGRLAWLSRESRPDEDAEAPPGVALGRRALARCVSEVQDRLRRFDEELTHLRRGYYAPEVRAASLLFRHAAPGADATQLAALGVDAGRLASSQITRPLTLLVVLDAPVPAVPAPTISEGRLMEHHLEWSAADRSTLETALRLRDTAAAPCRIEVAAVGTPSAIPLLREVAALGVDRVRLLLPEHGERVPADRAAAALVAMLQSKGERPASAGWSGDLVLSGSGTGEEGQTARLTAAALGISLAGSAAEIAVRAGEALEVLLLSPEGQRTRSLPAAVSIEAGLTLRPFTVQGYLNGLTQDVEIVPWPATVKEKGLTLVAAGPKESGTPAGEIWPHALKPWQASRLVLETAGLETSPAATKNEGDGRPAMLIEEVPRPFAGMESDSPRVLAVLTTEADGTLRPTAERVIQAAWLVAQTIASRAALALGEPGALAPRAAAVLVLVPEDAPAQQKTAAALAALAPLPSVLVPVAAQASDEVRARLLIDLWPRLGRTPAAVVGEPWTEAAFTALGGPALPAGRVLTRILDLDRREGHLVVETGGLGGKARGRQTAAPGSRGTCWLTLAADAQVGAVSPASPDDFRLQRWTPPLERFYGREDIHRLLEEVKQEIGVARLSDAEIILDVGFGVGNRDGYEAVIEPLEQALRQLGARSLVIGGSRKVTEELHLLPADRQIGQSGVAVKPKVLLAIGISGAPQHLNYIGRGATIVAFNRDPEAPILTLNQRQPQPRVFPVVGDLFETVPAFTAALRQQPLAEPDWPHQDITDGV